FNLIRGCTHGCIYCDSRSACYDIGPFEDIAIKKNAIGIMTIELARMKTKKILRTGGMSDPYVHAEKDLGLMKKALKAIHDHAQGISVLTKSAMILRDLDLYKAINQKTKAIVQLTVTTPDDSLARIIEPRVTLPSKRFETLKAFSDQGITTGIWMTPLLPFITDTPGGIRRIVEKAKKAGVTFIRVFGMGTTMREGSREYFYQALDRHFPTLKERYIKTFGNQYICDSQRAPLLWKVFRESCEAHGILYQHEAIDALFNLDHDTQLSLF
ncbi:MAG: radical SAM protein, partial [Bacillota bacterium]